MKGAELKILGPPAEHGATVTIRYLTPSTFTLYAPDGRVIAVSEHPRPLEKYAWANMADRIVHDYDLRLAET